MRTALISVVTGTVGILGRKRWVEKVHQVYKALREKLLGVLSFNWPLESCKKLTIETLSQKYSSNQLLLLVFLNFIEIPLKELKPLY